MDGMQCTYSLSVLSWGEAKKGLNGILTKKRVAKSVCSENQTLMPNKRCRAILKLIYNHREPQLEGAAEEDF